MGYSLKDNKVVTITNNFQKILNESNRKTNKIWVDKGKRFYNRSMKSWLEKKNVVETCLTHSKKKSIVAERFIKSLKNTIYKYMTSISKNPHIAKLDVANKYGNTYYGTIKIKPADKKSNTYIDFNEEYNKEGPKFKVDHCVKISKYK